MKSAGRTLTSAERAATGSTAGDMARAGQAIEVAPESRLETIVRVSPENIGALMTWATAHDGELRGPLEGEAWLEHVGGIPFAEAKEAVTEYFRQSRWAIRPGDVMSIIEEGKPL